MSFRAIVGVAFLGLAGCGAHEARTDSPALAPFEDANQVPDKRVDDRKIIYTADLQLHVTDFSLVPTQVEQLMAKHAGILANMQLGGTNDQQRKGTWVIRVPVEQFRDFMQAALLLGSLVSHTESSKEVTAEYHDLDARLRNKQREETRLLEHLANSTGKLDEILLVEREVSRARKEVERMQGQLQLLRHKTSMSTVTLNIREIRVPVVVAPPTFLARIRQAWITSWASLGRGSQDLLVLAVSLLPWVAVFSVPLLLVLLGLRFLRTHFRVHDLRRPVTGRP